MVTRQEIQIAQDLIKRVNIINDFLDCLSWQFQGIDPDAGGAFTIDDPPREPTVDDLKAIATRTIRNAKGYYSTLKNYLDKAVASKVKNGLDALGVDVVTLRQELEGMNGVALSVESSLATVTTKAELAVLGQYIDNNVEKLELVRRDWAI